MKKKILAVLTGALLFAGCATTSGARYTEVDAVKHNPQDNMHIVGIERSVILGPVFWMTEKKCSKIDFFKYVTSARKGADAVIDIQMEESTLTQMGVTTYSCKYAGLAVDYVPMNVDDKSLFGAEFQYVPEGASASESENAQSPVEPVETVAE